MTRLNALERDAARLEGERSQLAGMIAQAKGKISEIELQIIQIDQDLAQRGRQGPDRDPLEAFRTRRAQDRGGGPAQSRRYPRAAVGPRPRTFGAYRRRRDHAGRADHADRARRRRAGGRSQDSRRMTSTRSMSARRRQCASPPSTRRPRRKSTATISDGVGGCDPGPAHRRQLSTRRASSSSRTNLRSWAPPS